MHLYYDLETRDLRLLEESLYGRGLNLAIISFSGRLGKVSVSADTFLFYLPLLRADLRSFNKYKDEDYVE